MPKLDTVRVVDFYQVDIALGSWDEVEDWLNFG